MLRGLLVAEGCKIGRRHVKTLMQRMGIEALYRRPRPTKPEPGHKIYPYLLRGLAITRPNQVWAMDMTIAMARGFVYLAVALDWFSRRVGVAAARLRWRRRSASRRWRTPWRATASRRYSTPTRAQFTGQTFTGALAGNGVAISMDGKGAWRDNVFVERPWCSVKYPRRCICATTTASAKLGASIGLYFDFYNGRRPHASLDGNTPDQA